MRSRFMVPLAVCMLALVPARAVPAPPAPTLVVRVESLDALLGDLRFLAEAAGKGEEAKQLDGILKQFIGPKSAEGFDRGRPLAFYGRLGNRIDDSDLVVMAPVANETDVLAFLKRIGVVYEKQGEFYKVALPNVPFPGYFCFANRCLYATARDTRSLEKDRLLAPEDVVGTTRFGIVELLFDFDQVPQGFKDIVVGQMQLRLADMKGEKKEGQTDAEYRLRCASLDELAQQVRSIVTDGKSLNLKLDLDRKANELTTAGTLTPRAGTKLAENLAELGQHKSIIANLAGSDSVLNWDSYVAVPQGIRKQYEAFVDDEMQKALKSAPDKLAVDLLTLIFRAVGPTVRAGEFGLGFDLRGPRENEKFGAVAAVAVKDGENIERGVRAIHAVLPEEVRRFLTLDAARVGAVSIHSLTLPAEQLAADFKQKFGDGPIYFAMRKDAVIVAVGDKALDDLREVLAREPESGKMLSVRLSVARLAYLDSNADAAAIAKKVFAKAPEEDRVQVTLQGGKALELRVSAKTKILEFIALTEEAKKK